jgi:hypothetical protein
VARGGVEPVGAENPHPRALIRSFVEVHTVSEHARTASEDRAGSTRLSSLANPQAPVDEVFGTHTLSTKVQLNATG